MRYALLGVAFLLGGGALVGIWMDLPDWAVSVALASLLVGLGLVVFGLVKSIPRWREARALPFAVAIVVILAVVGIGGSFILLGEGFDTGPSALRLPTHAEPVERSDRLTGDMIRRSECVMVFSPDGEQVMPIWPVGYTYESWSRGGGLSGPAGANIVTEAEKITLVGQRVGWDEPRPVVVEGLRDDCGPIDLLFVAEVSVPPQ
jgi:hypothetical protein